MRDLVKEVCEESAARGNFSGVCLLRQGEETVFQKAYGYADRAWRMENRTDTRFDTASITKLFTAVAVLQLVGAGKLGLEDKITDIVDLSGTKIPADVTIAQLLDHTSGIADDADEEAGEDYSALFIDSPNYAIRECRDFLKNFAYKDPVFPAGTAARYCNCSYVLLGMALEQITGKNYREYFARHIFERAGMERTGFLSMDGVNENTAQGYISIRDGAGRITGYRKNIYSYPPRGTPDGGAYTTAMDLIRFMDALKDHVLLDEACTDMLFAPQSPFRQEKDWWEIPGMYERNGFAFECFLLEGSKEPFCLYKDGYNDGVAARLSYYPAQDITLVLLANQDCDVWEMTKRVQKEIWRQGL